MKRSWRWNILTAYLALGMTTTFKNNCNEKQKLLLSLQGFLCARPRPSGATCAISASRGSAHRDQAARRTVWNRTPHYRAAPRTECLHSVSRSAFKQKKHLHPENAKKEEEKKKKTFCISAIMAACAKKKHSQRSGGGRCVHNAAFS